MIRGIVRGLVAAVFIYYLKRAALQHLDTIMPGTQALPSPLHVDPAGDGVMVNPEMVGELQQAIRSSLPWMKSGARGPKPFSRSTWGRRPAAGQAWEPLPIYPPPVFAIPDAGGGSTDRTFPPER